MNMCTNHPDEFAVAYCRTCGKPLCDLCKIETMGAIYCVDHGPIPQPSGFAAPPPFATAPYTTTNANPAPSYVPSPYAIVPVPGVSPALAMFLGMIPGVGAIYNGQYAKGLIHAVVFGLLISIISTGEGSLAPLLGILIAVWWFYMVLEAYHTAKKRREGLPVDEFSSILHFKGAGTGFPLGAVVLIGLGGLLLLNTSGLIPIERLIRYWPMALIGLGVYMLYSRVEKRSHPVLPQELSDERR